MPYWILDGHSFIHYWLNFGNDLPILAIANMEGVVLTRREFREIFEFSTSFVCVVADVVLQLCVSAMFLCSCFCARVRCVRCVKCVRCVVVRACARFFVL